MARKIILPGQSRSTKCSTRTCQRLAGHKGDHRQTLTATPKGSVALTGGVEVLSADRYTVQEPKAVVPAKAAKRARRPKVVVLPMAEYTRLVAAASKVTRRSRYITSGRPSARLA